MVKIQFSDVTPPDRRSIRDIPIPNSGKRKVPVVIRPEKEEQQNEGIPFAENPVQNEGPYEYYYPKKHGMEPSPKPYVKKTAGKKFLFVFVALVAVLVFVVSMLTVFASASIVIVPKSEDIDVSLKLSAFSKGSENEIRYEIIKLTKTKTTKVAATDEKAVENKAKGKIVIYNNFSTEPQRLIIRTRFETPEGLVYRIPESVVVPGKAVKDGKETPGSIEVEVFADEPGEKYNIGKTDFTIPGFKNDPARFKNFYARSSTAMTGGFVGKMKTVSDDQKMSIMQNIDLEVQAELERDLLSRVPSDLVLISKAVIYEMRDLPQEEDSSSVILGKEATAYAMFLDKKELSNRIIDSYSADLKDWNGISSYVEDFSGLSIATLPSKIEAGSKIDFEIKGKAKVVAKIDTEKIEERLSGAPKKDAGKLIEEFPGILSVKSTIRPMWKQSFPENPLKIDVETSLQR